VPQHGDPIANPAGAAYGVLRHVGRYQDGHQRQREGRWGLLRKKGQPHIRRTRTPLPDPVQDL